MLNSKGLPAEKDASGAYVIFTCTKCHIQREKKEVSRRRSAVSAHSARGRTQHLHASREDRTRSALTCPFRKSQLIFGRVCCVYTCTQGASTERYKNVSLALKADPPGKHFRNLYVEFKNDSNKKLVSLHVVVRCLL